MLPKPKLNLNIYFQIDFVIINDDHTNSNSIRLEFPPVWCVALKRDIQEIKTKQREFPQQIIHHVSNIEDAHPLHDRSQTDLLVSQVSQRRPQLVLSLCRPGGSKEAIHTPFATAVGEGVRGHLGRVKG